MIFAINVGNTVTSFGTASSSGSIRMFRMPTVDTKTDLELMMDFSAFLEAERIDPEDIEGAVLSCVVPPLKDVLVRAMTRLFKKEPLIVDASCADAFSIGLKEKTELGANLIALSTALVTEYGTPAILINVGTATSFGVIDKDSVYRGGVLYPGMQDALDALISKTSLPPLSVDAVLPLSGKNTFDSIGAGVLYGHAGAVDRILDELLKEVPDAVIVASGLRGKLLTSVLKHDVVYDAALVLKGLFEIYRRKEDIR